MTCRDVVALIKKNIGVPWPDNDRSTRDVFKVGDPDTVVTGIASTWLCMFDVIKRAHAANLNMIITHEDTFWNDADNVKDVQDNPLYKLKTDYCKRNNMVVWRIHDHQHGRTPDQVVVGELKKVGIIDENARMMSGVRVIPETTLAALVALIKKNTGAKAIRVVGDPNLKVTRIIVGPGYAYPRRTADVDVVIGGEAQESDGGFDDSSYVRDAVTLGLPKAQILLGHGVSEEPGAEELAKWLPGFVTGVPIQFVPAGEPFWT
jgi:putative NIF3 family GTP cyclohydrolase 1 type 2